MITPNSSPPSRQTTSPFRTAPRRASAGDRRVRPTRVLQRRAQPLVEDAVVEEAGERVGLRLVLEPRARLRVVERECGGVAESLRELELALVERGVLAEPVHVEDALDRRARDERDGDQRLGLVGRRAGDDPDARIEVCLVREHRLAARRGPASDPLVEADPRLHDLASPLVPREHRHEAVEDGVEALLGEDVVEHVGEPAVRLDCAVGWIGGDEPQRGCALRHRARRESRLTGRRSAPCEADGSQHSRRVPASASPTGGKSGRMGMAKG